MKPRQRRSSPRIYALALALIALSAALACNGGSDEPDLLPGPSNVIVFGAQDSDSERYGLYLVRPDGAGLRSLEAEDGVVSLPAWSPEGGRIAYFVLDREQDGLAALRVYDFDTASSTTVAEQALAQTASWSPDGRRFVFAEDVDGVALLRIYNVGRDELVDLQDIPGSAPAWSPDGSEIAYAGSEGDLRIVDAGGEHPRVLLERPGIEANPRWSPDGRSLAFWSSEPAELGEQESRELLVLDVESGGLTTLGRGFDPSWSPDGTQLAYSLTPADSGATNVDLYLIAAKGGEAPQPLSQASTVDVAPSWSPDGNGIVYLAQADLQTSFVCLVQLEPEQRDCLDLPGLLPTAAVWSPQ